MSLFTEETKGNVSMFAISLNDGDKIRLIGAPEELIEPIRSVINSCWELGIQREQPYHGSHEFKLKGNPWQGSGQESVLSRRLLAHILTEMGKYGWNVVHSIGMSKKFLDKDSIIFESGTPDPDTQIFTVSLNMTDRIRVIDGPEFYDTVKEAVEKEWTKGIQEEKDYFGSQELKLRGNPWMTDGSDIISANSLICQIISNIRAVNYKLYTSVDVSTGTPGSQYQAGGREPDSWVFRKVTQYWN